MSAGTINWAALIAWFAGELSKVQQERPARQGLTESRELEWVAFEREKLLELINARRAKLGKSAVDMEQVIRAENSAAGHFDYTRKLALGAARLVLAD